MPKGHYQRKPTGRAVRGKWLAAMAKKYNVTEATVVAWEKAGAPMVDESAMKSWLDDKQTGNDEMEPSGLKEAKLIKIKAETEKIKFGLKVAKGEYTANDDVKRQASAFGAAVRQELMLLSSEAPTWRGLDGAALQDKARQFVKAALERLSQFKAK